MGQHIEEIDGMPVEVNSEKWAEDRRGYTKMIREKRQKARLSEIEEPVEDFGDIGKSL